MKKGFKREDLVEDDAGLNRHERDPVLSAIRALRQSIRTILKEGEDLAEDYPEADWKFIPRRLLLKAYGFW